MNGIRVLDVIGNKQRRRAPRINVDIHHNADDSYITKAAATRYVVTELISPQECHRTMTSSREHCTR